MTAPLLSEVITALIELQGIIGDQRVTLTKAEDAEVPLPGIDGLGITIE